MLWRFAKRVIKETERNPSSLFLYQNRDKNQFWVCNQGKQPHKKIISLRRCDWSTLRRCFSWRNYATKKHQNSEFVKIVNCGFASFEKLLEKMKPYMLQSKCRHEMMFSWGCFPWIQTQNKLLSRFWYTNKDKGLCSVS